MGFFSLKVTCGACDGDVGLNRFKIKKSDAWVCPDCLKKAGGITAVNVNKVTIEEIRDIIEAKAHKHTTNPMSTAQGMYQYCLENKFGSGFNKSWGLKHFGVLENNLMNNEEVLMTFIGLHNFVSTTKHDNNYAYAITNKRIIFGQKAMTGEKFKAVAHEKINDITFNKGLVFGVLTIDTPQEKFNVGLDRDSATSINSNIHQVLDDLKHAINPMDSSRSAAPASAADELKKFKELLDMDAITQEEYDSKKKQILGL
ncbi:PH domain-containing protein [Fictibacillus halophilus]|uniref:PH domain-containing protein n=1 Tax=Fictibacillus halophilus TaxID=1610490 RepID=UPI0036350A4B